MNWDCDVHWGYTDESDTISNMKDFDWDINLVRFIIVEGVEDLELKSKEFYFIS